MEVPSPVAQEELLRLLISSGGNRIASAVLDGHTVWIKRHDVEALPLAKRLHEILSPVLPTPLRASRHSNPEALVAREMRKMNAFREAGFLVPTLIHRGGAVMVMSHVAEIVQTRLNRLRGVDPWTHDGLLVEAASALGRAHGAGLCHGRPHPRDMFVAEGKWGFVDFEEEPEAVMPLRLAQGRDIWLLFLQICGQAQIAGTDEKALSAYIETGPAGSLAGMESLLRFFSPLIPLLSLLDKVSLGSDGRRFLKATRFLRQALVHKGAHTTASTTVRLGAAEGVKEGP